MKYCVLIIDGAAGLPIPDRGGKTCLELARTPNLDAIAGKSLSGLARTIPDGMEASSSNACMSVLGYDPAKFRLGRAAIEATSMGVPSGEGDVLFRCNLVTVLQERMEDYSGGHISTAEAQQLIEALNKALGSENLRFFTGVGYRHIARISGNADTFLAECTPPHDISGKPVKGFLPRGKGGDFLKDLMKRSEDVLANHPVNKARLAAGKPPANTIWLFWGSQIATPLPSFQESYGVSAAVTSPVDVIRGLGKMMQMEILDIPGVKDGLDNDFAGQAEGALAALKTRDLVVVHIEAADEAGHMGSADIKISAIEKTDSEVVARLRELGEDLSLLVMPDHPTPIITRTHTADPVPFLLYGKGLKPNGASRFTESAAKQTGLSLDNGYSIMSKLINRG